MYMTVYENRRKKVAKKGKAYWRKHIMAQI